VLVASIAASCARHRPATTRRLPPSSARTAPNETTTTEPEGRRLAVAPTGDDASPGDNDHPFRTLGHALSVLHAADQLTVHGGDYSERIDLEVAAGRADAPITVGAAQGERPILHGLLWLTKPSWWNIDGINVTWAKGNRRSEHMIKLVDGTDWSFTGAEVWDARSFAALLVAGSPARWRLAELYVHDTHKANGDAQDHLIYVNAGSGGGVIERCVLAHSPNGRAIKLGPVHAHDPAVRNVVVRFTTMFDNRGPSNVQLTGPTSNNRIEHNIMVGPKPDRANVTASRLLGRDNVIAGNVGFGGTRVLDTDPGLVDGSGNVLVDPQFADTSHGDFHPTNPAATAFGRYAP
jgi:hypothetical protein